jgi:hypothetical protein
MKVRDTWNSEEERTPLLVPGLPRAPRYAEYSPFGAKRNGEWKRLCSRIFRSLERITD